MRRIVATSRLIRRSLLIALGGEWGRRRRMTLAALLLALLMQDPKPPIVQQSAIDEAIKEGGQFLLGTLKGGLPSETPFHGGKGIHYDGLVLYTLKHSGNDMKDPEVQKVIDRVARALTSSTYNVATTALALNAIDPAKYRRELALCAQYLVDTQAENGQWGYGELHSPSPPAVPVETGGASGSVKIAIKRGKGPRPAAGDNSNAQYAALGLWACSRAGFEIDGGILDHALNWWESSQRPDGSWSYSEGGKYDPAMGSYGSMTAGGASSIVILRGMRRKEIKANSVKLAMTWLSNHWAVDKNPGADSMRSTWHYYYLYAVERLGDLLGTDKIGKWSWYWEGADFLVKKRDRGRWTGPDGRIQIADTCFAILFLERAMRVSTGSK